MIGDIAVRAAFDHVKVAAHRGGAQILRRQRRLFKTFTRPQNGAQLQDQEHGNPGQNEKLEQGIVHSLNLCRTLRH